MTTNDRTVDWERKERTHPRLPQTISGAGARLSSANSHLPLMSPDVTMIAVTMQGDIETAQSRDQKLRLLRQQACSIRNQDDDGLECMVIAIWPGKKRSDVFLLDNIVELAQFGAIDSIGVGSFVWNVGRLAKVKSIVGPWAVVCFVDGRIAHVQSKELRPASIDEVVEHFVLVDLLRAARAAVAVSLGRNCSELADIVEEVRLAVGDEYPQARIGNAVRDALTNTFAPTRRDTAK